MTYSEELTLLSTYYAGWVAAGMPVSYSINGRTFTRPDMQQITKRIDQLRLAVSRQNGGNVFVGQIRDPE